jgi:hypothetical protein
VFAKAIVITTGGRPSVPKTFEVLGDMRVASTRAAPTATRKALRGSSLLRKRSRLYQLNGNDPFYSALPHFGLKKTSTTRLVRRIHISNMTQLVNLSTDGGVRRK